jgi:hypothetical protein
MLTDEQLIIYLEDCNTEKKVIIYLEDCNVVNGELIIPEGVTIIARRDSYVNLGYNFKKITFPQSLITISSHTFFNCEDLTTITFSSGLTTIGSWAFYGCKNLTTVMLPANLTELYESAFADCEKLTTIILPSRLIAIHARVFHSCKNLITVTLSASLKHLGEGAFFNCEKLTTIHLPSELKHISCNTFSGCKNLTTITLPPRLKFISFSFISSSVFDECNVQTLILTGQLPKLSNDFFSAMTFLSSIIILAPKPQWAAIIDTLPQDYQSQVVTLDPDNVEHAHRVALRALLKAFHISPLGRAALSDIGSREILTRYGMTPNVWAHVYHYLVKDYPLYFQAKTALETFPLPTGNSASDFAKYQAQCNAIVEDYIKQDEQQLVCARIRQAITVGYLPGVQKNIQKARDLIGFWPRYRGESSVRQAYDLLAQLDDPDCTFEQLAQQLAQVWRDSSNTKHSLKDFLQTTLGIEAYQRLNLPIVCSTTHMGMGKP